MQFDEQIPADGMFRPAPPPSKKNITITEDRKVLGAGQLTALTSYYHDNLSVGSVLTELDVAGHDVHDNLVDSESLEEENSEDESGREEEAVRTAESAALELAAVAAAKKSAYDSMLDNNYKFCGVRTSWSNDFVLFINYVVFVAMFCIATLGRGSISRFSYFTALENSLVSDGYFSSSQRIMAFETMKTKADFFEWMEGRFLPVVLSPNASYPGELDEGLGLLLGGSVRLRQVRVEAGTCTSNKRFREAVSRCEAKLSPLDEEQSAPHLNATWLSGPELNSGLQNFYSFESKLYYDNGGYVVPLDAGGGGAAALAALKSATWVDVSTRLVAAEFVSYSPALGILATVRLAVEFMPSGDVLPTADIRTYDEWTYWRVFKGETDDKGVFVCAVCEAVMYVYACFYLLEEIKEFVFWGMDYFRSYHNILELFNASALVAAFACRFLSFRAFRAALPNFSGPGYVELGSFPYYSDMAISLLAIDALVVFTKFFKLLRFHKGLTIFVETIILALCTMSSFLIVMLVFFIAYGLAFYTAFGHISHAYMDLPESLCALLGAVLGNFNIRELVLANAAGSPLYVLGSFLFSSFIFVNIFVLMSMMFAMVNHSYDEVLESHFASYLAVPRNKAGKRHRAKLVPFARDLSRVLLFGLRALNRIPVLRSFVDVSDGANDRRGKAVARLVMGEGMLDKLMRKRAAEVDELKPEEGWPGTPWKPGTPGWSPGRSFKKRSPFKLHIESFVSKFRDHGAKDKDAEPEPFVLVENPKLDLLTKIVEAEQEQRKQLATIEFLVRIVRAKKFMLVASGKGPRGGRVGC